MSASHTKFTSEGWKIKSCVRVPFEEETICTCMLVLLPSAPVANEKSVAPTPESAVLPFCVQVMVESPIKLPTPCIEMVTCSPGPGVSGETLYCTGSGTAESWALAVPALKSARTPNTNSMLRGLCILFWRNVTAHGELGTARFFFGFVLRFAVICRLHGGSTRTEPLHIFRSRHNAAYF